MLCLVKFSAWGEALCSLTHRFSMSNFSHSKSFTLCCIPCDFRPWKFPQTMLALFIGLFEYVKRFRNLKFTIRKTRNIQESLLNRECERK